MKYTELTRKHSKIISDFPMAFAFSNEQFEEAKKKLGVTSNDELLSIKYGGIIKKVDQASYKEMQLTMAKDLEEAIKDDEYMMSGFLYELGNHEYCITGDPTDTFDCFGLTIEEVQNDGRLLSLFKQAEAKYYENNNGEW